MAMMNANHHAALRCESCGLPESGGRQACAVLFDEVLAQHFENPAYFGVHRLFVDTYCMQHPERGCVSFKSFAAHATHLCWSVERGGSRALPSEQIRRWVERHPRLVKPSLPHQRGTTTIADVAGLAPSAHHEAVWRWAQDVWSAYATLHPIIREWVDMALVDGTRKASRR
jgi:hypothetical protein